MKKQEVVGPENTAARVALWRALHVQFDAPPHVLRDEIGLQIVAPDKDWQSRPDMHREQTKTFRASIIARARFIEDLVKEKLSHGVDQYVILGAGLDTFAQREPEVSAKLKIFEVDQPGPQKWKQQRLHELGHGIPEHLKLVPVDFEGGDSWWQKLIEAGFDETRPAVVASTGVSMYLTKETNAATFKQAAELASGSVYAMSFLLPIELIDPEIRFGFERAQEGAKAAGTPFISFFTAYEIINMATDAGFRNVEHVSSTALGERYFSERTDGLRPPNGAEELLVASL